MAATSSMIINVEQADDMLPPTQNTAAPDSESTSPVSEDLLAEIQNIQQAIQEQQNFDFTTLEPTAAGNTQTTSNTLSNDKSASSPILLEDAGLLINYRSDDNTASTLSNRESIDLSSDLSTEENTDTSEQSTLPAINENSLSQVQASLSEDFITQAEGKLEPAFNILAQSLETALGSFSADNSGNWQYTLKNDLPEIQALSAGDTINDLIKLTGDSGQTVLVNIEINGTNDQAIITGSKQSFIQASPVQDLGNTHPSVSGKLSVSDVDQDEARFETNYDLKGSFGTAQINALGDWTYTLNNDADAIQGLRSGEKLLDLFSVKTLDGSKQLIQVTIEGVNDTPVLSGFNAATLELESESSVSNSLIINDPDFGESAFQSLSGIRSSLGYGTADIDAQGNWSFNLDIEYTKLHAINEGETRMDSFEVFTMDGTIQMVYISIKGSDSPFYAQADNSPSTNALAFNALIQEDGQQDELSLALNEGPIMNSTQDNYETAQASTHQSTETALFLNSDLDASQTLTPHLNDIHLS